MNKPDLIAHPIRLRIIQLLTVKKVITTQQLLGSLVDVPQTTLYRHLKKLLDADIIYIVDKKKARGAIEKTYALYDQAAILTQHDLEIAGQEDQIRYFRTFTTMLLSNIEQYLQSDSIDFIRDNVHFRQVALHLSNDELIDFADAFQKLLIPLLNNPPSADRQLHMLTTILLPSQN
ncbi:helix-turn-helix domain-containing protein [Paenibacillus antarcticus]|nr:helix-turn-helix domain-containing protein [Paenibacillus antarcticus]